MRHRKHNHQLGVKSAHRVSLVANLSCSLIEHGRIKTTLAKARALRPAIEKIITLAKKAHNSDDAARKVHYRRLAIAKLRNKKAVSKLFDELVDQFLSRNGGYTRIYKLALPRLGDAADMALIELVEEAVKKNTKKKKSSSKKGSQKGKSAPREPRKANPKSEDSSEVVPEAEETVESDAEENNSEEVANDLDTSEKAPVSKAKRNKRRREGSREQGRSRRETCGEIKFSELRKKNREILSRILSTNFLRKAH